MSFVRLEDLFVALTFAVVASVSARAVMDTDEASPLVGSAAVVMERSRVVNETAPLPAILPIAQLPHA